MGAENGTHFKTNIVEFLEFPQIATILWIPKILTDDNLRKRMIGKLDNPQLKEFLGGEFEKYSPYFRQEAISPVLNKIGQFLSNPQIRRIFEKRRAILIFGKLWIPVRY